MNLEFVKRVIELNGDLDKTSRELTCGTILCMNCIFSSYNNRFNCNCGEDTKEYYLKVAKEYLSKQEIALSTEDKILEFEEGALDELLDIDLELKDDTLIGELPEQNIDEIYLANNNMKVEEKKMTLKERILAKIDYSKVAELIYDKLEDEIAEEVAYSYDEEDIANDFVRSYKSDLLEVAVEVVKGSLDEDVDYGDIQDHFKDYVQEQIDNM